MLKNPTRHAVACALCAATLAAALAAPALAADGTDRYSYSLVSDPFDAYQTWRSAPSINSLGQIAGRAYHGVDGINAAVVIDGSTLTRVSAAADVMTPVDLSDNGMVAYVAGLGSARGVYRSSIDGSPVKVAGTQGEIDLFPPSPSPQVNPQGQVLFQARTDAGVSSLYQTTADVPHLLLDAIGPVLDFQVAFAQAKSGHVGFSARMDAGTNHTFLLTPSTMIDTGLLGMQSSNMNNLDQIVATAGGIIYRWDQPAGSSVAVDSSGGLGLFARPAINDVGDMVFRASDTTLSAKGIYTGPDRILDRVATAQSNLTVQLADGSLRTIRIEDLDLSARPINNAGQIVFWATFDASEQGWILATPVPTPASLSMGIPAAILAFRRRRG